MSSLVLRATLQKALPSMGEGQSMAILEALASATPVIISPECNFGVVDEFKAGAIVKRDASLIAQAISLFLSDAALRSAASESAYALARDSFGWKGVIDKLAGIYSSAIRSP